MSGLRKGRSVCSQADLCSHGTSEFTPLMLKRRCSHMVTHKQGPCCYKDQTCWVRYMDCRSMVTAACREVNKQIKE